MGREKGVTAYGSIRIVSVQTPSAQSFGMSQNRRSAELIEIGGFSAQRGFGGVFRPTGPDSYPLI